MFRGEVKMRHGSCRPVGSGGFGRGAEPLRIWNASEGEVFGKWVKFLQGPVEKVEFLPQGGVSLSRQRMGEITDARRKAIAESIHTISVEELKKLTETLFSYADHPWRERILTFISENPGATFHHATTNDHVQIIYCAAQDKGFWFMEGSGMGPLQPNGLKVLKEIVEKKR